MRFGSFGRDGAPLPLGVWLAVGNRCSVPARGDSIAGPGVP